MPKVSTNSGQLNLDILPDECPFCHKSITPNILFGHVHGSDLEVFLFCPDLDCKQSFIGYYIQRHPNWRYYGKTSQGNLKGKDFNQSILEISGDFVKIYNQAYIAEQQNLFEICGVGYRKAIEYLIKDYTSSLNDSERDKIARMNLGQCIEKYVNDVRIKSVVKRAVWLGNDETHYIRKWEGKNLQDLKTLIDLSVHWIEMEKLTDTFSETMPESK